MTAGQAIGEILAFGLGVALSPLAVITMTMLLARPGSDAAAWAFLGGWVAGLTVVGTAVLVLADEAGAGGDGGAADGVGVLKLLAGALLVVLAVREWRARPGADEEAGSPGWTTRIETMTAPRAAGLAVILASVKPKNLLLTAGAAVALAQTGADAGAQAVALGVFVLLGTAAPGLPLALSLALGDRAPEVLERLRTWMVREQATIVAVLCLVLAAKLIGDALVVLAG